ncbi:Two-component response regulator SSK1p [Basidiobolus ranarum]|uniref:Two-component response regulator SSK1p n=1 Tax=Basidiobolus ranarum TaxID=34480 RepID=A0ABR2VZ85_9FUNG
MGKDGQKLPQISGRKGSVGYASLLSEPIAFSKSNPNGQLLKQTFVPEETRENLLNTSVGVSALLHKFASLAYFFCSISSLASLSIRAFNDMEFNLNTLFTSPLYFLYIIQLCFWSYSFFALIPNTPALRNSLSFSLLFSLFLSTLYIVVFVFTLALTCATSIEPFWAYGNIFTAETSLFDSVLVLSSPFLALLLSLLAAHDRDRREFLTIVSSELKTLTDKVSKVMTESTSHRCQFIKTVAMEFEDTTSMAVQIVKQLSPPELLIKPQEHVSACSIPIPTASVTAIHTSLRHIINISSRLNVISQLITNDDQANENLRLILSNKSEFEIGGLIQSIGDLLAGTAAESKVELVLCHEDSGFHHMHVLGNENAFRHALIALVKGVISSTKAGTPIELGLHLASNQESFGSSAANLSESNTCQFMLEIVYAPNEFNLNLLADSSLTRKLIKELGGELKVESKDKVQMVNLSFVLPIPQLNLENKKEIKPSTEDCKRHLKITDEPSVSELTLFANTLRGLRVALHAKNHSTFAKHLTSCLTIWGTDITHISIDAPIEPPQQSNVKDTSFTESLQVPTKAGVHAEKAGSLDASNGTSEDASKFNVPPSFIIIDDDVKTLRDQFVSLRNNPAFNFSNHQHRRHKRMELLSNHMITSIIHFTSLSNYQHIKDEVYSLLMMPHHLLPPQVLVIPKPVGPKRLLTALYTAVVKPKVDPSYVPIATSPMSPGLRYYQNKEEERNPMDMINFDSYRPPTDSSLDSITVPTPSNGFATPIAGTIVFDPKQFATNGQIPTVSAFPRVTPYLNRRVSDQNNLSNPPVVGPLGTNGHTIASPMINGKPIALPPVPISRPKGSPSGLIPAVSSPIPRVSPIPTPLSAPLPATAPTSTTTKTKSKTSLKKKATRPSSGTSKSTSALPNVVSPPINVLIVEDNPINQTILSTFMKKRKIKYSVANNGLEAVEKWKEGGFHLVLMDIQLPVMDGIEATKKIRSIEKMQKIGILSASTFASNGGSNPNSPTSPFCSPVIILALTASSLQSDRHAALAAGCNDFLTKPVSLVWLEKKIMEWGCMQALIDFEGWRKWKSQDSNSLTGSLGKTASNVSKGKEPYAGLRESIIPINRKIEFNQKASLETLENLKLPTRKLYRKSNSVTKSNGTNTDNKVESAIVAPISSDDKPVATVDGNTQATVSDMSSVERK